MNLAFRVFLAIAEEGVTFVFVFLEIFSGIEVGMDEEVEIKVEVEGSEVIYR